MYDEDEEWICTMRRTMQEIVPGVFLGPYMVAQTSRHPLLLHHGITHIVSVHHDSEAHLIKSHFPLHFHYLVLNISDKTTENILRHFPVVNRFIDRCLLEGGKVLIHGISGDSRSAALTIAYVMESCRMTMQQAYDLVQTKRVSICPNRGFVSQLAEYEALYRTRQDLHRSGSGDASHHK